MLYRGSSISMLQFSSRLSRMTSKHSLSDAMVNDILVLCGDICPLPNNVPTLHRHKSSLTETVTPIRTIPCHDGEIFILPFVDQMCSILKRYPGVETLDVGPSTEYSDITTGNRFPDIVPQTLYFILNTDGFSPVLSRRI